jgi:hypothetical protein
MSLISRINILSDNLEQSRYNLRQQLSDKGVTTSSTEKLDDLIAKVADVEMGGSSFPYFMIESYFYPTITRGTLNYNLSSVTDNTWYGSYSIGGNNKTVANMNGMAAAVPTNNSYFNVSSDDIVSYVYDGEEYGINCYYEELLNCATYITTNSSGSPNVITWGFVCSSDSQIVGNGGDFGVKIALGTNFACVNKDGSYFFNGAPNSGSVGSCWNSGSGSFYIPEEVLKLRNISSGTYRCRCVWRPILMGYSSTTSQKYFNLWQTNYNRRHEFFIWAKRK